MNRSGVTCQAVAIARSPFKSRFGIPRQSGLVDAPGTLEPIPPWDRAEAWVGITQYSHLWLIWQIHDRPHQPVSSVRPPRLGGNTRLGVFATRAPARPNPLGLSLVRLEGVEPVGGRVRIQVRGLDLLDGTPILDIKPYIAFTDCPAHSQSGMANEPPPRIPVDWSALAPEARANLPSSARELIEQTLSLDPRPAFHTDPLRVYACPLADWLVKFRVDNARIWILAIEPVE
ncbi:tRNA (N6-threonylcarbamoyladenosine(37)-N6)-methyltransferase TrmO [Halothiobacillus sp. DCM-1]|uniref:tRNA (N6-threonylcarbamoyladenosine(37)-N6)-methyltransferase TrmO n=1 Tax=Halothiobacillus sp. DCM-1 TaxID=3112558 RepID=UPI003243E7D2